MTQIVVNVLSPYSIQQIVETLSKENLPFSISSDASNKGNRKFFPLAVRYFTSEGISEFKKCFFFTLRVQSVFFTLRAQSVYFAHARIQRHALNQAFFKQKK